jgi:prevent-host-death family protein
MRQVQSSDAKARLSELLDDVERGETVVITRHGRPIARIVPESDERHAEVLRTMERIEAFRKTMPRITLAELLASRHEGHKY